MIIPSKLPKLSFDYAETQEFVEFWSGFYAYPKEHLYSEKIEKNQFDIDDIEKLYEWKNGRNLSQQKEFSLRKNITDKIDAINQLKSEFNFDHFIREFAEVSAIWKIFLLHMISPQEYPIFDQHVYRAFYFLTNNELREIPYYNKTKEKIYFEQYVDFFKGLLERTNSSQKKMDEALWAFGKFLKTKYGNTLAKKKGGK